MNEDERQAVQAAVAAWDAFSAAGDVSQVASAYRALARSADQLRELARQRPEEPEVTEAVYWAEYHDERAGWVTGGCGYDYDNFIDALGHAEAMSTGDALATRVTLDRSTHQVMWVSTGDRNETKEKQ